MFDQPSPEMLYWLHEKNSPCPAAYAFVITVARLVERKHGNSDKHCRGFQQGSKHINGKPGLKPLIACRKEQDNRHLEADTPY
jgi:hypothetical protein